MEESDAAVAYCFSQLVFPPDALQELQDLLADGLAMKRLCLNAFVYVEKYHFTIYASCRIIVRGSSLVGSALEGARPRHPPAVCCCVCVCVCVGVGVGVGVGVSVVSSHLQM